MTINFKAATNYSWMSQASYLDLSAVTPGSANSLVGSLKQNSLNDDKVFADKQAATFVDPATGYSLFSQLPNTTNGTSLTVFKSNEDNTYTIAVRGTEEWTVDFAEDALGVVGAPRVRTRNAGNLLGLDAADWGQSPTQWQKSTYPAIYHPTLRVVHEGIDTDTVRPDPQARLRLPGNAPVLAAGEEIVTYVARNLEPYRGFPSFMRSLPAILNARPRAQVVIIGGDEVSYGARLPEGQTYRQRLLDELGGALDRNRVHFLGKVPYATFLKVLQVSAVHVYLTYPFVLSWSMLEAMAAGCLVVGSKTPPVEEVIRDGENGVLVDFFTPEAIAGRVVAALAEPEQFLALRKNARQTMIDAYDLKRICLPEQIRLLETAAGGRLNSGKRG